MKIELGPTSYSVCPCFISQETPSAEKTGLVGITLLYAQYNLSFHM